MILSKYSNVDISGQEYPIGSIRTLLTRLLSLVQYSFIALAIIGQPIRNYLTFIPEDLINKISENKLYSFIGYMGLNMVHNVISSTGAFEIYFDNKNVIEIIFYNFFRFGRKFKQVKCRMWSILFKL